MKIKQLVICFGLLLLAVAVFAEGQQQVHIANSNGTINSINEPNNFGSTKPNDTVQEEYDNAGNIHAVVPKLKTILADDKINIRKGKFDSIKDDTNGIDKIALGRQAVFNVPGSNVRRRKTQQGGNRRGVNAWNINRRRNQRRNNQRVNNIQEGNIRRNNRRRDNRRVGNRRVVNRRSGNRRKGSQQKTGRRKRNKRNKRKRNNRTNRQHRNRRRRRNNQARNAMFVQKQNTRRNTFERAGNRATVRRG